MTPRKKRSIRQIKNSKKHNNNDKTSETTQDRSVPPQKMTVLKGPKRAYPTPLLLATISSPAVSTATTAMTAVAPKTTAGAASSSASKLSSSVAVTKTPKKKQKISSVNSSEDEPSKERKMISQDIKGRRRMKSER